MVDGSKGAYTEAVNKVSELNKMQNKGFDIKH